MMKDRSTGGVARRLAQVALLAAMSLASVHAMAQSKLWIDPDGVNASSSDANLPANANDGALITRWSADATNEEQWLQYDLGACYSVAAMNLSWYNGDSRRYNFRLQTSIDANAWTDVFLGSNSGTTAELKPYLFAARPAQFVRVIGSGNNVNSWMSLNEMQVMANGAANCDEPEMVGIAAASYPGQNFNLGGWTLQLPTGSSGNIDQVSGSTLEGGFTKRPYFYSDSVDSSMVMMDPRVGWTTSGSKHPRTELREAREWYASGTNILNASVRVTKVPNTTAIAQILQGSGSPSKPLCELFYNASGKVELYRSNTNQGGGGQRFAITTVPLKTKFNYTLKLSGSTITVTVNGVKKSFGIDSSFNGSRFYFKAGNYDQTAVAGSPQTSDGTVVKFYSLGVTH
jgi:hypothetical protein